MKNRTEKERLKNKNHEQSLHEKDKREWGDQQNDGKPESKGPSQQHEPLRLAETQQMTEALEQKHNELEHIVAERTEKLQKANEQLQIALREQQKIAAKLQFQIELDQIILEASSNFIKLPLDDTDACINDVLARIAKLADVPRCAVYILADQYDSLLTLHEYFREAKDKNNDLEDFHDAFMTSYLQLLRKQKDIIISSPDDLRTILPGNHKFDEQKFQPLVAIPMLHQGGTYGALVLYGRFGETREWPSELAAFLKIIGGLFVNALERKMSDFALRQSENDYRDLVEKAGLAIFIDGSDTSFHYFNKRFEELFGYSAEELHDKRLLDLVHPDDREMVLENHNNRYANKPAPTHFEFRGVTKKGRIVHLEVDVVELRSEGRLMATRGYLWDVTSRVEAERAIQESEARYRGLVENFTDIVFIANADWDVLYANPAFERITGYALKDLDHIKFTSSIFHKDDFDRCDKIVKMFLRSDATYSQPFELRLVTKSGEIRLTSTIVAKISYVKQNALQFILHDITEQRKATKVLKKSAAFEHTVSQITTQFVGRDIDDTSFHNALAAMGEWSEASRVSIYRLGDTEGSLYCWQCWSAGGVRNVRGERRVLSLENTEWWHTHWRGAKLVHVADVEKLPENLEKEKELLRALDIKAMILLPFYVHGKLFGALSFEDVNLADPWSEEDIQLLHISCEILSNALERLHAEKLLQKSEEQYRMLFESNNDGIYLFGFDREGEPGVFLNVNATACRRLGYHKSEMLNMTILQLEPLGGNGMLREQLKQLHEVDSFMLETEFQTKQGDTYPVELKVQRIELDGLPRAFAIERDITERKRVEEEMQKAQRLESIGLLAGGIAHDFNNLLSIILGNSQLISLMGENSGETSKYIQNIEKGVAQATNLTQQLLTFSKGGAPVKSVIDVGPLIQDAVNLALSGLDEVAEVDIEEGLWHTNADRGQLRQVLQNLILNADQAMPNGGVIRISARNVHASEVPELRGRPYERYVEIRVADEGVGIPPTEQSKVFDPYYTTKKRGSGLGLSVAYSVIKKHDGLITLESQVGKGTMFIIYLPASQEKEQGGHEKVKAVHHHTGRILIMDDEEMVRHMAADMLRQLGYKVDTAADGERAIELYQQAVAEGKRFDAVIMDLTIPAGMGGKEAILKLREIDPDVKAVVSSGYSNDKVMANYRDYGFAGMAAKPYTMAQLSEVLSSVLGGAAD